MKRYPKVPRYDHPLMSGFFESGEVIITEKYDGSNIRFTLYEERFDEEYKQAEELHADSVFEVSPQDGDIVYGTRQVVRGTSGKPMNEVDAALKRVVANLKEIDKSKIRKIQDEYGPLIFFAEGMIYNAVDYNYEKNPPPPLIGFDVYSYRNENRDSLSSNPYEEKFEGFLDTKTAYEIFEKIGVPPAETPSEVEIIDLKEFNIDEYEVPTSNVGEVQAEGVVFRKEEEKRRTKYRTEKFQELNKKVWGKNVEEAETGEEKFVAMFVTQSRIRKIIRKMVVEEGYEFSRDIINDLYPRVIQDIWQEEWAEIKDLNFSFNPSETNPLIAKQCAAVVKRMEKNAKLNDANAVELWREISG